jgi:hypothetical protein
VTSYFLLSDSNSQAQAMKKLRDHSSAMFAAKCFLEKIIFENISSVISNFQSIDAICVENLLKENVH